MKALSKEPKSLFILAAIFFMSCSNDSKDVAAVSKIPVVFPLNEQHGAHITYSDSGQKVLEIRAGLLQDFGNMDPAYVFFGEGITVNFYKREYKNSNGLKSGYGKTVEEGGSLGYRWER